MTDPVRLSRAAVSRFALRRKPGYEAAIFAAAFQSDDRTVTIRREDYDRLRDEFALSCGPGCQLRRTFAWFGVRDDGSCGCAEFAAKMDAWGPACWQHMEEIVDHLREAAAKRGLPFIATSARIAIARAIEAGTPPAG